jgi:large subunit ribosomal protein L18e
MAKDKMKSNPQLQGLISALKEQSRKENAQIWRRVALDLEKPTRARRVVNLSRISRFTKENESIIVPGKLLGSGEISHKVTVAAYNISKQAEEKLQKSKCTYYTIFEFMKKNPQGKNTRVIG